MDIRIDDRLEDHEGTPDRGNSGERPPPGAAGLPGDTRESEGGGEDVREPGNVLGHAPTHPQAAGKPEIPGGPRGLSVSP
jgi:hypothetical protein